jgi:4-carboxymuconolactone decarboxylase
VAKIPSFYEQFREQFPAVAAGYQQLGDACRAAGPLDERTAELVKLGMSIAAGAEGGSHSHTRRALAAGASRAEVEQVAMLAITTLGFPQAMRGYAWMRDVLDAPAKKD